MHFHDIIPIFNATQQKKNNNQNGMKIVPIAYAICYTKITMNEKNTTERKIIKKKCERKKKQWKSSNINSLGTNDILSTIETWL